MELLVDAEATEGNLFMARTRLAADDASPVHVHAKEDEIFRLLDGSGVLVRRGAVELKSGGVVYLPRHVPHAYRITADADLLTICTPAGAEKFFRSAGRDLATPKPSNWALSVMSRFNACLTTAAVCASSITTLRSCTIDRWLFG
jgi:mannose-6-phosphate isomerase-like protein (cupin superfamily)